MPKVRPASNFQQWYYTTHFPKSLPNILPTLRGCPRRQSVHGAEDIVIALTRSVSFLRRNNIVIISGDALAGDACTVQRVS